MAKHAKETEIPQGIPLIEELGKHEQQILDGMLSRGEQVRVAVSAELDQALVATDHRVMIIKAGPRFIRRLR